MPQLTEAEQALNRRLLATAAANRLEQEQIGQAWLLEALAKQ